MRVLITGITGFIGAHLARRLGTSGREVHGLAADGGDHLEGLAASVSCTDILDLEGLAARIAKVDPEVVVHLAGLSHVGDSWKRLGAHYRVNFVGTRNVLRAAGRRKVLVASSAAVYGPVPAGEQPIAEDRSLDPRSPYAITKACAEQLALDAGAVVVRPFNVIGPGQSAIFAMPSFAGQLAAIARGEQENVLKVGDLSPRRDFLHVADAVDGYEVLIGKSEAGTVYNLASGEAFSIEDLLKRLRALSGVDARIQRDESRVRTADLPLLVGDASRLRALGWAPRHSLDEALASLWATVK